jgi:GNAT superfamily N-acetyltransferase
MDYDVKECVPSNLSTIEIEKCVLIITQGDAVGPEFATVELPRTNVMAVARKGFEIVGVGAIKRNRTGYASGIAKKSGFAFDNNISELGYVAVDENHRHKGLSRRIVSTLVAHHGGRLFATTDNPYMEHTLATAGFGMKGQRWNGNRGLLSLWIKE